MQPLVSILIPVYNTEEYLPKCLDSIVNQTYSNLQVVIIDDGSKDASLSIAQKYAKQYLCIEVYHQENVGVAAARNKLISLAKGDFILFIDSDDWVELDMVENMLILQKKYNADIVSCGCFLEDKSSTQLCSFVKNDFFLKGKENILKVFLYHKELTGSLWNKLIPRKFYKGLSFRNDIWYGEDCLFLWELINQNINNIFFTSKCYYHYRMSIDSISHENFNYKKISGHLVWKQIYYDTQIKGGYLNYLGKMAFVRSDMWLLFFAVLANYPQDEFIRKFQLNVRENIFHVLGCDFINCKIKLFGVIVAISYRAGGFIIKLLK